MKNLKIIAYLLLSLFIIPGLNTNAMNPTATGSWNQELSWDWNKIDTSSVSFPPDFLWGTSTSAYQV